MTALDDIVLRPATIDDAEGYVAHARALAMERTPFNPATLEEVRTLDQQRATLQELLADPRVFLLVATKNGKFVGEASLRAYSRYRATDHVRVFGIGLAEEVRGRGLGKKMTRAMLDWADAQGVVRVELQVYADNARAIALYEKMGFVVEGTRRKVIRRGDTLLDELLMARIVETPRKQA